MEQTLYPVCCAYMISQSDKQLVFRTLSGRRYIFKSNLELILALLEKSTGMYSINEIANVISEDMKISAVTVRDAADDLVFCEILMDSREQFLKYHILTFNPPAYPALLSLAEIEALTRIRENYIAENPVTIYEDSEDISFPFLDLLQERHSCRNFLETTVEPGKLFAICKASYSSRICPVASAGALFPLYLYFVNRISSRQLPAGVYQYDNQNEKLLLLDLNIFPEVIQYSLNDTDYIFGAPCIFFVCADIRRHMKKYANAGYRYSLLEAGHVVQNMTIAVGEMGLGGVEYGGFCDEAVKQMLRLPDALFPLACYAVGYEDEEKKGSINALTESKKCVIEKIVQDRTLDIDFCFLDQECFKRSNLRVVVSRFENALGQVEFGTGTDPAYGTAYMKSVMESYERYTLSYRYFDRLETAEGLGEKYVNPNEYVPYSDEQREANGFAGFQVSDLVEWLQGYDLDGYNVYIPADLCFYMSERNGIVYHAASSSGCAAHFDIDIAKQKALLELIERDAVVKNWFYKQTPKQFDEKDMSDYIRQRLIQYQTEDISVFILSLPCEYAYTVLVCSVKYLAPPYFVAGAGASFSSVEDAITKAFDEWEVSFVLGETVEDSAIIAPEEVVSPKDHGRLYRCSNYNKEINYLLQGQKISISEVAASELRNIRELAPVFVTYRPFVDGVYVVRALSKELVPINFGYKMDFFNHLKLNRQLLKNIQFPHFFS